MRSCRLSLLPFLTCLLLAGGGDALAAETEVVPLSVLKERYPTGYGGHFSTSKVEKVREYLTWIGPLGVRCRMHDRAWSGFSGGGNSIRRS